jgi:predicted transcriptional regulator of viral defense system
VSELPPRTSSTDPSSAAVRRVGYLLDFVRAPVDTTALAEIVQDMPLPKPALLDPRLPRRGIIDTRLHLDINADVDRTCDPGRVRDHAR